MHFQAVPLVPHFSLPRRIPNPLHISDRVHSYRPIQPCRKEVEAPAPGQVYCEWRRLHRSASAVKHKSLPRVFWSSSTIHRGSAKPFRQGVANTLDPVANRTHDKEGISAQAESRMRGKPARPVREPGDGGFRATNDDCRRQAYEGDHHLSSWHAMNAVRLDNWIALLARGLGLQRGSVCPFNLQGT